MASSRKAKGGKAEEKEEREVTKRRKSWKKFKESRKRLFTMRRKEDEKAKESRKRAGRPKVRQTLGKFWRWLLLLLLWGRIGYVSALQRKDRREGRDRMQREVQVKKSQMGGGSSQKED